MTMSIMILEDEWRQLVSQFEAESPLNGVTRLLARQNLEPYAEEVKFIVLKVVSTIYTNAYSSDNATKMLYELYCRQLKGLGRCNTPLVWVQQKELLDKTVKTMPKGFRDCIMGTYFLCDDGYHLTVEKATEFLNWLNSPAFEEIERLIITRTQ